MAQIKGWCNRKDELGPWWLVFWMAIPDTVQVEEVWNLGLWAGGVWLVADAGRMEVVLCGAP